MNTKILTVMEKMISLYRGDAKRIQHFTKVFTYASYIGRKEGLDENTVEILELAALTHDIGIHECERKYGSCPGNLQEKEGPNIAEPLLREAGIPEEMRSRICFLISRHHTYTNVTGLDWRILLEADFIVNGLEDNLPESALLNGFNNIFRTKTGKALCADMFGL